MTGPVSPPTTPTVPLTTGTVPVSRPTASGVSSMSLPSTTLDTIEETRPTTTGERTTTTVPNASPSEPPAATTTTTDRPTTTTTGDRPTTTTAKARPPRARTRRVTMAFTGDMLTHSPLWNQALENTGDKGYDFRPMLARLGPLVKPVDLAVCHLETPIAPEGEQFTTAPAYGVPPEVVDSIAAAGYDRCSTASNHTLDRGTAGIDRTVSVLESRGVEQSGMARTPEEITPRVFEMAGVKVSHLSYTFGYNGSLPPAGQEWRSALIDPDRIIADARAAEYLGAEIVIVSMHWGNEGIATPTAAQVVLADTITASGAVDLIVGHHAHVLQPIEQINGTWVMYGLGNILSNLPTSSRWPASSQDGAVATIEFTVSRDGKVTASTPVVHPTWVDRDAGWLVRPVVTELADPATPPGTRTQLEISLARTRELLGPYVTTG